MSLPKHVKFPPDVNRGYIAYVADPRWEALRAWAESNADAARATLELIDREAT